jgi:Uncharacterized protein conserved in bacteria (DUF2330)
MGTSAGSRSFLTAAGVVFAMSAASLDARAMGAIVSTPAGAASATEVRVAVASTGTRTSRWASIHVHGNAAGFAWIVPVRTDAFVDLASDAWFESLERATAPRVVPPDASPPCGPGGVEVEDDLSHVPTVAPRDTALVLDASSLASTLSGWNIAIPDDLSALVEQAGAQGDAFLALHYTLPDAGSPADVVTTTVRIVDSGPGTIPLSWTAGPAGVGVTAYTFTPGSATPGAPLLAIDPSMLLWRDDGTSTYPALRDTALASMPGGWLLETAGHAPLFDGENDAAQVPALAPTYYSLAATYGDATGDPSSCASSATGAAASAAPVALACPAGSLARGPAASCAEAVEPEETAPGALRCGGIADDLAMALSGGSPAATWVARSRSLVPAATFGEDAPVTAGASLAPTGPVIACTGYDATCGTSTSGAPPPPAGGNGTTSSGGGSGGQAQGAGDPGGGVGSTVGAAAGAAIDTSDGCGGDSSDDSGDSCGSNGSGSSDSSDDGGGCSGSSSGSDDSSSSNDCSTSMHGRRRSSASRLLMTLAAIAVLARRWDRRDRAGSTATRGVQTRDVR